MCQENPFLAMLPISSTNRGLKVSGGIMVLAFCLQIIDIRLPALLSPYLAPSNVDPYVLHLLPGSPLLRPLRPITSLLFCPITFRPSSLTDYTRAALFYIALIIIWLLFLFKPTVLASEECSVWELMAELSRTMEKICTDLFQGRHDKYGEHVNENYRNRAKPPRLPINQNSVHLSEIPLLPLRTSKIAPITPIHRLIVLHLLYFVFQPPSITPLIIPSRHIIESTPLQIHAFSSSSYAARKRLHLAAAAFENMGVRAAMCLAIALRISIGVSSGALKFSLRARLRSHGYSGPCRSLFGR